MTAVLAAVVLALVAALVVLVDVKPWRRPRTLTVRITVDTAAYDATMARVVDSFRPYERTKDVPAPADPCPFPRLRVVRWLP